jgi:hypothetical protein
MADEEKKPGYWQVERRVERGEGDGEPVEVPVDAEPVPGRREATWLVAELCSTMEEAHQRARARARMGQTTRVVPKFDGRLLSPEELAAQREAEDGPRTAADSTTLEGHREE